MEWKDGVMVYADGELDQGGCAPDPRWGASQLRAYGVGVIMESKKLKSLLLCSKVLELAEVRFRIEPAEGDHPAVEGQAAATELVQGEALGDVKEASAL